MRES